MSRISQKQLRILGFIEGFERLHRVGPTFAQVWAYEVTFGSRHTGGRQALQALIGRLHDAKQIHRAGTRFHVVSPQRQVAFVFNRSLGTLEELNGTDKDHSRLARLQD